MAHIAEINDRHSADVGIERAYEIIGSEYYDSTLHPTCANFRSASAKLIARLLRAKLPVRRTLDLGAGRSIIPEIEASALNGFGAITLFDGSPRMLANNAAHFLSLVEVLIGHPNAIPSNNGSFDLVISSLGDPYNQSDVWAECVRVLSTNGTLIYTTPAHEWMVRYRIKEEGTVENVSRFIDRYGRVHDLPSYVYSPETQVEMFRSVGLRTTGIEICLASEIPGPLSPKLVSCATERLPIVRGFLLEKI